MCLGIPLQVRSLIATATALCSDSADHPREVNCGLLEQPPTPGDWLLVHVDMAIRTLSNEEAQQIGDALRAVVAASRGESFEHLIADLVDREPELPEHLRPPEREEHHHG